MNNYPATHALLLLTVGATCETYILSQVPDETAWNLYSKHGCLDLDSATPKNNLGPY